MSRWSPTVLPEAPQAGNYDALFNALNQAPGTFMAARGQRDAKRFRDQRQAIEDARYEAQQGRQATQDAEASKTSDITRANAMMGLEATAGSLGYVPEGRTAASATSNFRGTGGAAGQLADALNAGTQNQPRRELPTSSGPQSFVLDPTRTPDAREESQARKQLERAMEMQERSGAVTLRQAPQLAAATREATIGVDRANRAGDFAPKIAPQRAPQMIETPEGYMLVDTQTGQARPVTSGGQAVVGAPRGMAATEGERKANAMLLIGQQGYDVLESLVTNKDGTPKEAPGMFAKLGQKAGIGTGNYLTSDQQRQMTQAADQLAEAWLRYTSGAVFGKEEIHQQGMTYVPQPGDDAGTLKQKQAARAMVIEALRSGAGRAAGGGAPAPNVDNDAIIRQAVEAIQNGANPDAVRARVKKLTGHDLPSEGSL